MWSKIPFSGLDVSQIFFSLLILYQSGQTHIWYYIIYFGTFHFGSLSILFTVCIYNNLSSLNYLKYVEDFHNFLHFLGVHWFRENPCWCLQGQAKCHHIHFGAVDRNIIKLRNTNSGPNWTFGVSTIWLKQQKVVLCI